MKKMKITTSMYRFFTKMMETDANKRYLIEFKSILLDIIEKFKTFERVNLATFLQTFKQEQKNEGIDNIICAEVIRPERAHKPVTDSTLEEESEEKDSMLLESVFQNDMPTAKKEFIKFLKTKYMGATGWKRLEMLTRNPNLPDGLLLKFRKCSFC